MGRIAAVLCLAAFVVQAVASMRLLSASSDETTHLPAGYTYLRTGDFRLNPQHPPLAKLLAAAPLLALGPKLDLASAEWSSSPPDEWNFGRRFLYTNDADRLLFWGRLPMVGLGLLLGIYTWLWARDLFGEAAGAVAALLFAFCPTIVAHTHLVTMDVGLAAFSAAAAYHLRTYALRGGFAPLALSGAALGLALATKFSAVFLAPVLAALVAAAALGWGGPRASRGHARSGGGVRAAAYATGAFVGIAALVVWATYFFPRDPLFYWHGITLVNRDHDASVPDYLMGAFRVKGWWYYFPLAMLFKTPLPTLAAIALGAAAWWRHRPPGRLDGAILLLPALAFAVATAAFADNMGVRYVLPIHAPLFVLASASTPWLLGSWPGRVAAGVLATWLVLGAWFIYPDHLAYFNEAAGGPLRGPDLLDDSNIDWGQDLKRLKGWMDANRVDTIRLLYPWNGSPQYYGIRYEPVTSGDWLDRPQPGVYAISTMALVRGRLVARTDGAHSDWLDRYQPVDRVGYSFYIYRFAEAQR
jgi:hypothetical protein